MLTEQAIITALPAGVDRDRGVARLSCFVTLRATGEAATLHATRFFADWPQALSGALPDLEVEIAGTGRVPSAVVSPAPESGLWRAIFAPGTPVEPHEPERWTQRPVATYAARDVHAYVVDLLARTAAGSRPRRRARSTCWPGWTTRAGPGPACWTSRRRASCSVTGSSTPRPGSVTPGCSRSR